MLNRDLRIVTIGGGTGNSILLRGLKKVTTALTTIVTVADDGGGSGVLRKDLGMLPPGDIRACLLALANTEPAMEKLLSYRFKEGHLEGQSMGNLILAAMNNIYNDFDLAIKEMGNVLAITGKVLPMTLDDIVLFARLEDGSVIEGESNITFLTRSSGGKIKEVYIEPKAPEPLEESLFEIENADMIFIGPGSLYTSIIPNLLVPEISEALKNTQARIYYVCNIMTQPGETDHYSVTEHIEAIEKHIGARIIDVVMVNQEKIPESVRLKYHYEENSEPVYMKHGEKKQLTKLNYEMILGNFCDIKYEYVRHDADCITKMAIENFMKDQ